MTPPSCSWSKILGLGRFLIVFQRLFTVLKVFSSQLITSYLDRMRTVSHTLHYTEGENNRGWIIHWQEAAHPTKKWLNFRNSSPNVDATLLFNLKLSPPTPLFCNKDEGQCVPLMFWLLLPPSGASVTRLPGIRRRPFAPDDIPLFSMLTGRSSSELGQEINSRGPPDSTGGVFKEQACWTLPITKHKM